MQRARTNDDGLPINAAIGLSPTIVADGFIRAAMNVGACVPSPSEIGPSEGLIRLAIPRRTGAPELRSAHVKDRVSAIGQHQSAANNEVWATIDHSHPEQPGQPINSASPTLVPIIKTRIHEHPSNPLTRKP
jgi:hypothetical protein